MGLSGGYQVAGRVCRIGRHQLLSRSRDCHYPASAAIRHYAEWVIRKDSLSCQTFYSNNRYLTSTQTRYVYLYMGPNIKGFKC